MAKSNHLLALTKKNIILWKRNPLCSICEIVLPFLMCCLLFIMRSTIERTEITEQSYVLNNQTLYKFGLFKKENLPYIKRCQGNFKDNQPTFRNGDIALAPKNNITQDLYQAFIQQNYTARFFGSKQEILDYTTSAEYKEDICFGISIDSMENSQYQYSLMFNTTKPSNEIPDTLLDEELSYKVENIKNFLTPYAKQGFLTIQQFIDNIIIRTETGVSNIVVSSNLASEKLPNYVQDNMQNILIGQFGIFLVLPLILPFLRLTYGLLIEKEKKIREGMRIMGMSSLAFYLSWIVYYLVIFTIISLLIAAVLQSSIFPNTEYSVLFVWHWIFTWSLIFQGIFITAFFTKAKVGNIAAMLWYLANFIINTFLNDESIPYNSKILASLSTQAGIVFSGDVFLLVEAESQGIGWSNINKKIYNYSIGGNIGMTFANILIFLVLSLYADQVVPNDFGKKKHPLFFLDFLFKKKQPQLQQVTDENVLINIEKQKLINIEAVDNTLKEQEKTQNILSIKNLSKTYPNGKSAVKNVSLTMYNGQIFVLLGHNGAGKTTTISMLTGMLEFTNGEAQAFGKNVKTDMDEIRQFMGVCPQHDILFDDLSVKEHLELFATFKGMDKQMIANSVEKAINDVDLKEKTNELAKNLSGGQRRRLSVAIAFIGDSKLIYLDEPTSGMDTSARRHIWEMLKKYKNDRVVVLTTHFMDEADFLGDRIGIMGEGELICCGSSVFLKNTFGIGYNLTIVKKDITEDSQQIINYVKEKIPSSNLLSNVSAEISIQLPMDSLKDFSQLFAGMDQNLEQLKIQSYGISITTLEEVFLRVADLRQAENKISIKNNNEPEEIEQQQDNLNEIDNFDLNSVRIQDGFPLFITHFIALFMKRIMFFKRDTRGFICEICLPCIIVIAGLSVLLIQFFFDSPPVVIDKSLFTQPIPLIFSGNELLNQATKGDMQSLMSYFDLSEFNTEYYQESNIANWDNYHFSKRSLERKGAYYFNSIKPSQMEYTTVIKTNTKDSGPYLLNRMNTAILRKLKGNQQSNIQITINPFPLTQKQRQMKASASGIAAAFMFSIGLAFIPASLITFIVKEKQESIKHQQLVSGVSLLSYWLSNFVMDMVKHLIPALFCILMVLAYDISDFTGDNYGPVVLLFFLYGWSIIPFSYLFSFLFNDYGNAQVANFFLHFLLGSVGPLIIYILRMIVSTRDPGKIIGWILRLIPSFSFGYGILNIGAKSTYTITENLTLDPYTNYDLNIAGGDILMMAIEGVFYFALIFVIEKIQHMKSIMQLFTMEQTIPFKQRIQDEDVEKEEQKILRSNPIDYTVYIKELRKVFIPDKNRIKVAVEKVSFGIQNGECFTLLGVNGAGKTTTFKMLTGEINPTSGQAFIKGYDIQSQLKEARSQIGYCPQFDALLENLTAREHLMLYAAIKGIPQSMREQLVQKKLKEMDLLKFDGIPAGTFSGGNKRKLSVAIAMLGNPAIVFLDEPSTGMDPQARRFMWTVISRISTRRKQSSVILTTHSMEEAEALSTTIAIQVDGSLQCYGSVQHIKNKFGEGYEVEIKLQTPSNEAIQQRLTAIQLDNQQFKVTQQNLIEILGKLKGERFAEQISEDGFGSALYLQLKQQNLMDIKTLVSYIMVEENGEQLMQFIHDNLGNFEVIEHFQTFYRFRIISKISIGKVFGSFEDNKANFNIIQYSVKQPTIEQIFNLFAQGKIGAHLKKKQSLILSKQDLIVKKEQIPLELENQIKIKEISLDRNF